MNSTQWAHQAEVAANGITAEHGQQLGLLDKLLEAVEANSPTVDALLGDLLTMSDLHFGAEEVLMREHSAAKYHLHVEEHARLVGLIKGLRTHAAAGAPVKEELAALRRQVAAHIDGLDGELDALVRTGA